MRLLLLVLKTFCGWLCVICHSFKSTIPNLQIKKKGKAQAKSFLKSINLSIRSVFKSVNNIGAWMGAVLDAVKIYSVDEMWIAEMMEFGGRNAGLGALLEESQVYQKRRVFRDVVEEACNMRVRGIDFYFRKIVRVLAYF
jgi:hypothetical protein